jgi:hypothetical protein
VYGGLIMEAGEIKLYPFLEGRKKYYFHGQYGNFFLR